MRTTIKELKQQFADIDKLKCFEIPVIDIRTGEDDYILCDISIIKNSIVAQYVPLNKKQERSKFIASSKIKLDTCFSIDEHLQELHTECIEAILSSEFYQLNN